MNFSDSDKFYSGFPSYNDQASKRQALAKARQVEYQTFLQNQSKGKSTPAKNKFVRHTVKEKKSPKPVKHINAHENGTSHGSTAAVDTNSTENSSSDLRSREFFLKKLAKMNGPDIFNDVKINARNRQVEEDNRLKKAQYQQELKAQIEERQREKERLRALDLEHEDRLNRKIEAQQKLLQLQEELERRRHTQNRKHAPINIKVTPPSAAGSSARRTDPFEANALTSRSYDERRATGHKENINDEKAYRFFSNSSRDANELMDLRPVSPSKFSRSPIKEISPKRQSYNTYPAHRSNAAHHQNHQDGPQTSRSLCHFCKNKRLLARSQIENIDDRYVCGSCEDIPICLSCRQELCSRCKKPIKLPKSNERSSEVTPRKVNISEWLSSNSLSADLNLSPLNMNTYRIDTTTDDDENATNSPSRPPYSFNIKETSIFHPSFPFRESSTMPTTSRNIPFDELKRITDEKLTKLSQNYGEMAGKQFIESNGIGSVDSFPMPLLRDNTDSVHEMPWTEGGHSCDGNSNAFKRIQTKWQVPAVQKNLISQNFDTNTRTLTQIGAFRRQLQLDKLNFGDDHRSNITSPRT